jgi:hydrogenase nickel incorporation protein HypA/HybF
MHELSIAMSIVDMAQEEAERRSVQVDAVHLELGALSGVVKEALLFSYEVVVKDIPIEVFCPGCKLSKTLKSMQWFYCPDCGAATSEILHGKELIITALELKQ